MIAVNGVNGDGRELAAVLDIKFLNCGEAVDAILKNDDVAELLSENSPMMIAVAGSENEQSDRILSNIETYTAESENVYYCSLKKEEKESAENLGLSYGKYRSWLTLQELNSEITAEQVNNMSMMEIRNLIEDMSSENEYKTQEHEREKNLNHGVNGSGHKYGQKR